MTWITIDAGELRSTADVLAGAAEDLGRSGQQSSACCCAPGLGSVAPRVAGWSEDLAIRLQLIAAELGAWSAELRSRAGLAAEDVGLVAATAGSAIIGSAAASAVGLAASGPSADGSTTWQIADLTITHPAAASVGWSGVSVVGGGGLEPDMVITQPELAPAASWGTTVVGGGGLGMGESFITGGVPASAWSTQDMVIGGGWAPVAQATHAYTDTEGRLVTLNADGSVFSVGPSSLQQAQDAARAAANELAGDQLSRAMDPYLAAARAQAAHDAVNPQSALDNGMFAQGMMRLQGYPLWDVY